MNFQANILYLQLYPRLHKFHGVETNICKPMISNDSFVAVICDFAAHLSIVVVSALLITLLANCFICDQKGYWLCQESNVMSQRVPSHLPSTRSTRKSLIVFTTLHISTKDWFNLQIIYSCLTCWNHQTIYEEDKVDTRTTQTLISLSKCNYIESGFILLYCFYITASIATPHAQ